MPVPPTRPRSCRTPPPAATLLSCAHAVAVSCTSLVLAVSAACIAPGTQAAPNLACSRVQHVPGLHGCIGSRCMSAEHVQAKGIRSMVDSLGQAVAAQACCHSCRWCWQPPSGVQPQASCWRSPAGWLGRAGLLRRAGSLCRQRSYQDGALPEPVVGPVQAAKLRVTGPLPTA